MLMKTARCIVVCSQIGLLLVVSALGASTPQAGAVVQNRALALIVETDQSLRSVTVTATFEFGVAQADTGAVWFIFPPINRADSLHRIELDGTALRPTDLVVAHESWGTRFVLPASALKASEHWLTVSASWPAEDRVDFTHWGSWHPYLGLRSDPVPITLEVQTDAQFQVVASGTRVSDSVSGGRRVARWRTTVPQGWMLLSIGRYGRSELAEGDQRLELFWPAEHQEASAALMAREPFRVLDFYRRVFGPPLTNRLTVIEIPGEDVRNFAVDGLVAISRGSYRRLEQSPTYLSGLLAHELAHLWWGDRVQPTGAGAQWLNEGFAEFSRYLYERDTGGEPLDWSYRNLVVVRQFAGREPPSLADGSAEGEDESLYYQKGAFVLHMLANEVGEQRVLEAMRSLAEQRQGGRGTLDAFVEAAGGTDMRWFFDQWLTRRTGPMLALSSPTVELYGDSVVVRSAILQRAEAYRLRVPVVAYGPDDTVTHVVTVEGARTAFELRLPSRPTRLALDPAGTLFKWFTAADLPLEFSEVSRLVGERRCLHAAPTTDTAMARRRHDFLARRFPDADITDPDCPVQLRVGPEARELRERNALTLPPLTSGTVSAFVVREGAGAITVVGIEGDAEPWPELLIPEAPLTFVMVRNGQIIAAWGASLPRIGVSVPPR
jgi:hypothetical protein